MSLVYLAWMLRKTILLFVVVSVHAWAPAIKFVSLVLEVSYAGTGVVERRSAHHILQGHKLLESQTMKLSSGPVFRKGTCAIFGSRLLGS